MMEAVVLELDCGSTPCHVHSRIPTYQIITKVMPYDSYSTRKPGQRNLSVSPCKSSMPAVCCVPDLVALVRVSQGSFTNTVDNFVPIEDTRRRHPLTQSPIGEYVKISDTTKLECWGSYLKSSCECSHSFSTKSIMLSRMATMPRLRIASRPAMPVRGSGVSCFRVLVSA
jgi:hypothetical protein